MPLSDHEQRLLEQMERALYAEDPKFATTMRNPRPMAGDKRRIAVGVVGFLVGMGMLLAGVAAHLSIVGVVGFLIMLAGIWMAVAALRPAPQGTEAQQTQKASRPTRAGRPRSKSHAGESLTQRMEERWRRRRETGDF